MPEETRYITWSGNVPNGGLPPSKMLVSAPGMPLRPHPSHYPPSPPTFSAAYSPPPSYNEPQYYDDRGYQPNYRTLHSGPLPRGPPGPQRATPPPAAPRPAAALEVPGQYLDGHMLVIDGYAVMFFSEYTAVNFLDSGIRPFDGPNGYYPHPFGYHAFKVPSTMTLQEFMVQLGLPAEGETGITEMEELGDDRFTAGVTITQGTEEARKTLAEIGWTPRKSETAPIWIVKKR